MSDNQSLAPFIPSWLDDLGLTSNEFRVCCHLSRRAGKDGKCHPAASSIMTVCHISENTVWKILKQLESMELIVREKHFRNANAYVVATAKPNRITAIEGVIQNESPQSEGCQSPQKRHAVAFHILKNLPELFIQFCHRH